MTTNRWRQRSALLAATLILATAAACGGADETTDLRENTGPIPTNEVAAQPAATSETTARAEQTVEPAAAPENLAPELSSAEAWYNTEPLTLEALRGEPVLLVFWATY